MEYMNIQKQYYDNQSVYEWAAYCQWRIELWRDCGPNYYTYAYYFYLIGLILSIIISISFFSHFFYLFGKHERRTKSRLFIINSISFVGIGLLSLGQVGRFIIGLPGDAFGINRIILELFYVVPYIFAAIGGSLSVDSWATLLIHYERSILQTSRLKIGIPARITASLVIIIYIVIGLVTAIVAGIHPLWSNLATQIREGIWAVLSFCDATFLCFIQYKVIKILSEAKRSNEKDHINGMRRRFIVLLQTSSLGLFFHVGLGIYMSAEHYNLHNTPESALLFWIASFIVTQGMVVGWQFGYQMYYWKPFIKLRRTKVINPEDGQSVALEEADTAETELPIVSMDNEKPGVSTSSLEDVPMLDPKNLNRNLSDSQIYVKTERRDTKPKGSLPDIWSDRR